MSEVYLVRHGQASFGAANYDKLSPLGHQQSSWLGEYFLERNINFDAVLAGTLVRQQETATGIIQHLSGSPNIDTQAGLNEFSFSKIIDAYISQYPEEMPSDKSNPKLYYALLKSAMFAWLNNKLDIPDSETWGDFDERVGQVVEYIRSLSKNNKRILVVSSGGAISMILKHMLGLESTQVIHLNLQVKNTGITHFFCNNDTLRLSSFNNVPHLDTPNRLKSITYS